MSESYFSELVIAHKAAFINETIDAIKSPFAGILPHNIL